MRSLPPALVLAALLAGAARAQNPSAALAARAVPAADLRHRYGADSLREGELWLPSGAGPHPVAIVIHGGCWLAPFADHRYMRPLAVALRDAGYATWNVRYRRADEAGGGWPGTFDDVAAGADALRALARRAPLDTTRVVAVGHSAGAHLALWLAARPRLQAAGPTAAPGLAPAAPLRVAGVVAIDGPGDLVASAPAVPRICGGPVFDRLMGGTAEAEPVRWRAGSPAAWLPLGVPQAMVIGGLERPLARFGAPEGTQAAYARRARAAGDSAWTVAADSTHHFNMLDPAHAMWSATRQAVRDVFAVRRQPAGGR
jgi:acetyl esterase/lipase